MIVGGFASRNDLVFALSISNFPGLITWPRYSTESLKNVHFLIFKVTPASPKAVRISSTCCMCSSTDLENMIMSSMYTRQVFHLERERMTSRPGWKVAGALVRPNGMRVYWNCPAWQTNAVFPRSSFGTSICQYQLNASSVVKMRASPRVSMHSSMRGRGYESLTVIVFSLR